MGIFVVISLVVGGFWGIMAHSFGAPASLAVPVGIIAFLGMFILGAIGISGMNSLYKD